MGVLVSFNTENMSDIPFYKDMYAVLTSLATTSRIPELSEQLDFFNFKSICPIPNIPAVFNMSFAECCDESAIKVLQEAESKQVLLSWSGGIDSTIMLTAILRNGYDSNKHKIKILCDSASVKEYVWFFYNVILQKFETQHIDRSGSYNEDTIVYTGDLGDQVFGSEMATTMIPKYGGDFIYKPYKDGMYQFYGDTKGDNGKRIFEHYLPVVDYAPFKIDTIFDFIWWWNFSQKWQHCKIRQLMWGSLSKLKYHYNNRSFYDTDNFQLWSIFNQDKKIGKTLESYKLIGKEYVVEYTKDNNFLKKPKVSSISTKRHNPSCYMLDENYNPIFDYEQYINLNRK